MQVCQGTWHTIYQMARWFSLAGADTAGNIIHDYTAVLLCPWSYEQQ